MPTEKPHTPEPLTSHDPYPRDLYADDVDPMAERRRNSRKFYDGVDAAIAARPKAPSYITTYTGDNDTGITLEHDDGHGTTIAVAMGRDADNLGRLLLTVTSLGDTVSVELPAANGLVESIRRVMGMTPDKAAPITGSR